MRTKWFIPLAGHWNPPKNIQWLGKPKIKEAYVDAGWWYEDSEPGPVEMHERLREKRWAEYRLSQKEKT